MKILALDLGDVHVGSAITDNLGMFAFPNKTIEAWKLTEYLEQFFSTESIATVVVGYPRTLRGTESAQTAKVVATKDALKEHFPHISWVLWDERLTSKSAAQHKKAVTKQDKLQAHSIAASIILESYLEHLRFNA